MLNIGIKAQQKGSSYAVKTWNVDLTPRKAKPSLSKENNLQPLQNQHTGRAVDAPRKQSQFGGTAVTDGEDTTIEGSDEVDDFIDLEDNEESGISEQAFHNTDSTPQSECVPAVERQKLPWVCIQCEARFADIKSWSSHVKTVHKAPDNMGRPTAKANPTMNVRRSDMISINIPKAPQAGFISQSAKAAGSLIAKKAQVTTAAADSSTTSAKPLPWVCSKCLARFADFKSLNNHVASAHKPSSTVTASRVEHHPSINVNTSKGVNLRQNTPSRSPNEKNVNEVSKPGLSAKKPQSSVAPLQSAPITASSSPDKIIHGMLTVDSWPPAPTPSKNDGLTAVTVNAPSVVVPAGGKVKKSEPAPTECVETDICTSKIKLSEGKEILIRKFHSLSLQTT